MKQNEIGEGSQAKIEFAVFHTGTITTQFALNSGDVVERVEGEVQQIITASGMAMTPQEYYSQILH